MSPMNRCTNQDFLKISEPMTLENESVYGPTTENICSDSGAVEFTKFLRPSLADFACKPCDFHLSVSGYSAL